MTQSVAVKITVGLEIKCMSTTNLTLQVIPRAHDFCLCTAKYIQYTQILTASLQYAILNKAYLQKGRPWDMTIADIHVSVHHDINIRK